MGDGARIGPFNVFRDVRSLRLGASATISQWNWISAAAALVEAGAPGSFAMGKHSAVTSRHYLDVSGGVSIGEFTTVAGVRSTFITHGIRWTVSEQSVKGIEIGDYCLISSNVSVTPGTVVENKVVVGMGATISGQLQSNSLYVQPRAALQRTDLVGSYFSRRRGFVDPAPTRERDVRSVN